MPRGKKAGKAVVGAKDVVKEVGVDEAWKAKIDRDYEKSSEILHHAAVNAQAHLEDIQLITKQALANMVVNCNHQHGQMIRHTDVAVNAQWNLDEQGYQVIKALESVSEEQRARILAGFKAPSGKGK